ncbi:MAG: UDP-N-acetylmuramate--L-alanine ligase [Bdellovibrionales bacterium]
MKQLQKKNLHFIGIGGIGMCGLAELLHNLGTHVTGSDLQDSPQVKHLKDIGIPIFIGHKPSHIHQDTHIIVYSSAVQSDNVELVEAHQRGLTVIRRAEALAEMMRLKQGIVVAGTHGKTTTTALLASIFSHAGRDPTVVAGGRIDLFQSTAHLGKSEWFIAESDESDGSFHHLYPELVVLTNIDDDHLDFYGDFSKLKKSFSNFLKKIPFYGSVIACGDCPHVKEIVESHSSKKRWLYGFKSHNDFILKKEKDYYVIEHKKQKWGEIHLPLKGDYNALNALGALVCSWQSGLKKEDLFKGLTNFKGVQRRMESKGSHQDILFFDDYAHHPTEVGAVLSTFKQQYPNRRKVVLFQPHRYTRFQSCWKNFLNAFSDADCVFISEVYSAGELPLKGIDSKNFVKQCSHPDISFIEDKNITSHLSSFLKSGDIFVTLGAGSVYRFGENILKNIRNKS